MKLFFDSNIWVAGFATHGLCADLVRLALRMHGKGSVELFISRQVLNETERILHDKFHLDATSVASAREAMAWVREAADGDWLAPDSFPDPDDIPIVGAAIAAGADLLVTGVKAMLALEVVSNTRIVQPRACWIELRTNL